MAGAPEGRRLPSASQKWRQTRRFHYDTIAHNRDILLDLVRLVGADRVVCGTDFPADMSDVAPVPTVDKLTELSASEREMILGGNAARLLKL